MNKLDHNTFVAKTKDINDSDPSGVSQTNRSALEFKAITDDDEKSTHSPKLLESNLPLTITVRESKSSALPH